MLSVAESNRTAGAVARTRYARIPEVLPIPNLIELQLDSFKWFIEKGLRELFDEISPIKDFTGKVMELQFLDYEFGRPEVHRGGVPDQGPDVLRAALRPGRAPDQGDRRDPAPARLHGRLPVDDRPGHVRDQRRRARRRQPARPLAGRLLQRARGSQRRAGCSSRAKVIPNRGAWLEFETNNKDQLWVKVDRKRKIAATTLLRAVGYEENDDDQRAVRRASTRTPSIRSSRTRSTRTSRAPSRKR